MSAQIPLIVNPVKVLARISGENLTPTVGLSTHDCDFSECLCGCQGIQSVALAKAAGIEVVFSNQRVARRENEADTIAPRIF